MRREWQTKPKIYITDKIFTKTKDGEIIGVTRPLKIWLRDELHGTIVNDGRQVVKEEGKWIYYAQ